MKRRLIAALVSLVPVLTFVNQSPVSAVPNTKVTICHRTHSVTNPYVRITVSQNAVGNGNGKHGGNSHDQYSTVLFPAGKPYPNVYNPAVTYTPAPEKKWGDIIAFTDVLGSPLTNTAATVAGLNNVGLGAMIFNGTGAYAGLCKTMSARDYYEVEVNEGNQDPADVLADMNEAESDEWASAKDACGGSFTGCAAATLGIASPPSSSPANNLNPKVTICHRTHSVTNPYVRITVSQNAVGNGNGKHGGASHDQYSTVLFPGGKPNPNVFNPAVNYSPAPEKKWGDIIAFTNVLGGPLTGGAAAVAGLNNTGLGAMIFNGTGAYAGLCRSMSARDYYEVQVNEGGRNATEVLADMTETEADEWSSALIACGGTFVGCQPSVIGVPTPASSTRSIRGLLWIDSNRDGIRSVGENVLANYPLIILPGPGNSRIAYYSVTTDASGNYELSDIPSGNWIVRPAALPNPNYEQVYDTDSGRNLVDWQVLVALGLSGQSVADFAAALTLRAIELGQTDNLGSAPVSQKLRGTIWLDANRDGLRGGSERVLANYPLVILPGSGNLSGKTYSVTTDAGGYYEIVGLPAGDWIVRPADLQDSRYERIFDSDSGLSAVDWLVAVMVPAGGEGIASFAAALTRSATAAGLTDSLGSAPAYTVTVLSQSLPATGPADLGVVTVIAMAFLVGGWVLIRRRRYVGR